MLKSHNLAKSISDVAWRMLVTATERKAAYSGSQVVLVGLRKTSQMCSWCGLIVKKELSERVHRLGSKRSHEHSDIGNAISS
jgi:putative transposase